MKTVMFEQLLNRVGHLSARQRSRLAEALTHAGCASEAVAYIGAHFELAPRCPHCGHVRVVRHPHANGLQRFRCQTCGNTFNALTSTPLAEAVKKNDRRGMVLASSSGWPAL